MARDRVGFVGLGLMGHGMAANIVGKGHELRVIAHKNRDRIDDLVRRGATEVKTLRELAEGSDVVVLCLTGSPQVEDVVAGADGLASAGKPLFICDCSTSDPSSTVKLAEKVGRQGITLVDAPLSRTPKDALAGTLDVMVGGDDSAFERIRPILESFAGRIVRTGPVGSGHTMKLLNNFVSLGYAALYSEALAIGAKAGLSPQVFDSVIRNGRMDSPFYRTFFTWVLDRDPNAHQFSIANALKDLTYLSGYANASGAANPLGAAVRNSFAFAANTGHAADFVPTLSDVIAEANGVKLT